MMPKLKVAASITVLSFLVSGTLFSGAYADRSYPAWGAGQNSVNGVLIADDDDDDDDFNERRDNRDRGRGNKYGHYKNKHKDKKNKNSDISRNDSDFDNDGIPNRTDRDDDNDGRPDIIDNDDDNDGISDRLDNDDDNDGIADSRDPDRTGGAIGTNNSVTLDGISRSQLRNVVLAYLDDRYPVANNPINTGNILGQVLGNVFGTGVSPVLNVPAGIGDALDTGEVIPSSLRRYMTILPTQVNAELGLSSRVRVAVLEDDVVVFEQSTYRVTDIERNVL